QLDELTAGSSQERELFLRDYAPADDTEPAPGAGPGLCADMLSRLSADELLDMQAVAAAVRPGLADDLEQQVSPRGSRLLGRVPGLPAPAIDSLVEHFGGLQKLLSASVQDLKDTPGFDAALASRVREGLSRLAESALLDSYS